jgi:hypothetical protein
MIQRELVWRMDLRQPAALIVPDLVEKQVFWGDIRCHGICSALSCFDLLYWSVGLVCHDLERLRAAVVFGVSALDALAIDRGELLFGLGGLLNVYVCKLKLRV